MPLWALPFLRRLLHLLSVCVARLLYCSLTCSCVHVCVCACMCIWEDRVHAGRIWFPRQAWKFKRVEYGSKNKTEFFGVIGLYFSTSIKSLVAKFIVLIVFIVFGLNWLILILAHSKPVLFLLEGHVDENGINIFVEDVIYWDRLMALWKWFSFQKYICSLVIVRVIGIKEVILMDSLGQFI